MTGIPKIDSEILKFLDIRDLMNACLINRYFASICADDYLWMLRTRHFYSSKIGKKPVKSTWRKFYLWNLSDKSDPRFQRLACNLPMETVLDVSNMKKGRGGMKIIPTPDQNSPKIGAVVLPIVSDNLEAYKLAMEFLGHVYELFIEMYRINTFENPMPYRYIEAIRKAENPPGWGAPNPHPHCLLRCLYGEYSHDCPFDE